MAQHRHDSASVLGGTPLSWLQETMLAQGNIGPAEFGLITVVDEPGEVVEIIRKAHAGQAWRPESPA